MLRIRELLEGETGKQQSLKEETGMQTPEEETEKQEFPEKTERQKQPEDDTPISHIRIHEYLLNDYIRHIRAC